MLKGKAKRNNDLTYDILAGMTIDAAAKLYGFNSRQAAQKAFRLTVVNFFTRSYLKEIVENNYKISYLRQLWSNTQL